MPLGSRSGTVAAALAPVLAALSFALWALWDARAAGDWTARLGIPLTFAALVASAWTVLLAPSRPLQIAAAAAALVALATAALWFLAWTEIVSTSTPA